MVDSLTLDVEKAKSIGAQPQVLNTTCGEFERL
jgi:hypothetical protein